ncbi:MAG: PQQ-binding-like beta-propeller repeat protein [Myxococcales bacterium]|nr:PQQ-binding-like beta-propeller repeat protein [Myxococcales bacterium]MCB9715413.1 PQQ-binding-like beta-propeller repeat protein [Myxococcales bacterium]
MGNVGDLQLAWSFVTGSDVSATPTVFAGDLFVPDWGGSLYSLDASTGDLNWSSSISDYTGIAGDFSRTSPVVHGNKLIIGSRALGGATLMAVDRHSGALLWSTSLSDHPAAIITQSPTVHGNKVFAGVASLEELFAGDAAYECCTFRGSLAALDLDTGEIEWQTYMAPDNGGSPELFSGNAVWGSSPAVDPSRGAVYIATGNNYEIPTALEECLVDAGDDGVAFQMCLDAYDDPANLFDAIVSLDMDTGEINWAKKLQDYDSFNIACIAGAFPGVDPDNCPNPTGPDYDFGQAPMLWHAQGQDFVGAGQKSGFFWALDRDTGDVVWAAVPGPGGAAGGMQWGSATDGELVYVSISNYFEHVPYELIDGTLTTGGSWSALDAATGEIVWQTADPGAFTPLAAISSAQAPLTVANDVVYGASTGGGLYAMDAYTGQILWDYDTGVSNMGGASVVNGMVYWGSGYGNLGAGIPGDTLYAFGLE